MGRPPGKPPTPGDTAWLVTDRNALITATGESIEQLLRVTSRALIDRSVIPFIAEGREKWVTDVILLSVGEELAREAFIRPKEHRPVLVSVTVRRESEDRLRWTLTVLSVPPLKTARPGRKPPIGSVAWAECVVWREGPFRCELWRTATGGVLRVYRGRTIVREQPTRRGSLYQEAMMLRAGVRLSPEGD